MSVYLVIGSHRYRGHDPGVVFEANLDRDVEERAVRSGAIEVLKHVPVALDPANATPPRGWTVTTHG